MPAIGEAPEPVDDPLPMPLHAADSTATTTAVMRAAAVRRCRCGGFDAPVRFVIEAPSAQVHRDIARYPDEALAFTIRGRPLSRTRGSLSDAGPTDVEIGAPP